MRDGPMPILVMMLNHASKRAFCSIPVKQVASVLKLNVGNEVRVHPFLGGEQQTATTLVSETHRLPVSLSPPLASSQLCRKPQ